MCCTANGKWGFAESTENRARTSRMFARERSSVGGGSQRDKRENELLLLGR